MNVGLVAHDGKKNLMQNLCIAYQDILKKHKIHPDIRYVTRNEFSSLSMVEHELGYSILPGLLLRGQQGKFVKRPLKPTITRQLGLAYSSLENLSPASKTFLEYAKDFLLDD